METDPDFQNEEKLPPSKSPGGLELVVIIIFLLFVAKGTYEFGVWLIKDGSKPPKQTEQFP
jgi:hypothetical protein